ncbi:MAG: hypothetical protein LBF09_04850 [Odoribacteraceae bacterium]|nr:hypothetical protein [Odoribacteraceae bacterium]
MKTILLLIACSLATAGCATWHQRLAEYHVALHDGDFERAGRALDRSGTRASRKNRVLYYMNKGYLEFARGNTAGSNEALETAETLADTRGRDVAGNALALVSNPGARAYRPEDFELIMINFYKAMNYLAAGDMEGALVETRRINIKLNQLNDKYPGRENRYRDDAFAHLLAGLIHDAAGDDNNAFIAYRNAHEVYRASYATLFGLSTPLQLKKDLLRSAYRNGFTSELRAYEEEFGMTYAPAPPATTLVLFWLNGLGPVKTRWRADLVTRDGVALFHDEELGITLPVPWSGDAATRVHALSLSLPRHEERRPFYARAVLTNGDASYPLEIVENINDIAFKTLRDRLARELLDALPRLLVKKSIERVAGEKHPWIGTLLGIVNSATEQADTRNWQTLPYAIHYARVPLRDGDNEILLRCTSPFGEEIPARFTFHGNGKGTLFHLVQTMK